MLFKIFNIFILGYLCLVCILGLTYKHISFGMGLGDFMGYIVLFAGTILHVILTYKYFNSGGPENGILVVIFLSFALLISLKATLWRGSEYKWNGSVFYLPCPHRININNGLVEKSLLVQMCSGDYNSKFSGIWSGSSMKEVEGELKIPEKLKRYINYPVDEVLVISDSYSQKLDDKFIRKYHFESDSLVLNHKYELSGEITNIIDKIPVFRVRLKNGKAANK